MRKVTTISIIFVFSMAFIGIQVNKHYLKGELYSSTIFEEAIHCCDDTNVCGLDDKLINSTTNQNDCSCENGTEVLFISNEFIGTKYTKLKISAFEYVSVDIYSATKLTSPISMLKILDNRMKFSLVILDSQAVSCVFLC